MSLADFGWFAVFSAVLAWVPGPTIALIAASSLRDGLPAGLSAVAGTQIGYLAWLLFGLAAAASITDGGRLSLALQFAGALYLAFLGFRLLSSAGNVSKAKGLADNRLLQGALVLLCNPKMFVLFGSLIPAYLPEGAARIQQTLLLGLLFMAVAVAGQLAYAAGFAVLRDRISARHERWLEMGGGIFLLACALGLALR